MFYDWMDEAACRFTNPDDFFASAKDHTARERAVRVCLACPVRAACLAHALTIPDNPPGVWGATSENERRRLRKVSA